MSKGLEALEELKNFLLVTYDEEGYEEDCITLEQYDETMFYDIEKELKALKIIKEKEPDISFLYRASNLNHYNSCVWKEQELTQEEWDLLKEVFANE